MRRNEEIIRIIKEERLPILPFELEHAQRAFRAQIIRQKDLAGHLGEAMNQTSETWHDNAAADAVASDSAALTENANYTRRIIEEGQVLPYEAEPDDGVTLGSIVDIRYGSSQTISRLYITGSTRELSDDIKSELPEADSLAVATIFSPIGKALLGVKAGDTASFSAPNGRVIELHIEGVQQAIIPIHKLETEA